MSFGRGLSTEVEPDLWQKDLSGTIEMWIEVGQRDEKSIRQACGRATRVCVYTYGGRGADQWWKDNRTKLDRLPNLTVLNLPLDGTQALIMLAQLNMDLHCTIQDGQILMGDGERGCRLS